VRFPAFVRRFAASPAAQLVVGAIVVAFAFPATPAAAVARAIAFAALGVVVHARWTQLPRIVRAPPPALATAIALAIVAVAGLATYWDALVTSPDWPLGDWGPQHAVLARVMPSLPGLDVPTWNHAVSTGDAPLELYPALTYLVTGHVALLLGLEHDLPLAFAIVAVVVHVALAVATTALASRVAPRPIAIVLGLAFLVDSGEISEGGTVGLFRWGLLHSAFAHVFAMIAALGVVAALRRPRVGASLAIWLGIAIATAAHPAGLLAAAAYMLALAIVAVLPTDVPPRRALAALGHVALGAALGAMVWLPAADRLVAYGQHFPNKLLSGVELLQALASATMPATAYAIVTCTGLVGAALGAFARRAEVAFVAAVVVVMIVAIADAPYLALGVAPGQAVARLGAWRMLALVRPFVYAAAAFALAELYARARVRWIDAPPRARTIAAAALGMIALVALRVAPELWSAEGDRAFATTNRSAPDPHGRAQLDVWAQVEMTRVGPAAWARALFEEDTHDHMHLTATTGLPTLHLGWLPDLLLRERIEDGSDASLRRFNIKWVIARDRSPTRGDPASERRIGSYHVRDVANWDGKFARVERGDGAVTVARLDDRAVVVDVAANAPVLVALGTGYYPRWRATHTSGADEPVYALPAIPNGTLHVVAAWLAPGRTTYTCDAPLPSDGRGRIATFAAALLAIAALVAWSRARWRFAILRRVARAKRIARAHAKRAIAIAAPVAVVVLVARGCAAERGRADALVLGGGARADAEVEARVDGGAWETCSYAPLAGAFRCADVDVLDGTANLVNDAPPSWAFTTPAIVARAQRDGVEIRVRRELELAGAYSAAVSSGRAELIVGDDPPRAIEPRAELELPDRGRRTVTLVARVPVHERFAATVVAVDTLSPPRPFLAPPPEAAPDAIRAIGSVR
jgi:hypothetical protein